MNSNSSKHKFQQALGAWDTTLVMPSWYGLSVTVGMYDVQASDKLASAVLHMCHENDGRHCFHSNSSEVTV